MNFEIRPLLPALTFLLSGDAPEVQEGGLLADRWFKAGPVNIKAHSVLTHRFNNVVTVNDSKPTLQILSSREPMEWEVKPVDVEVFARDFAEALKEAQLHQMAVQRFIEAKIHELVQAYAKANPLFPCLANHDWVTSIEPEVVWQPCSRCNASRNKDTGEIIYRGSDPLSRRM